MPMDLVTRGLHRADPPKPDSARRARRLTVRLAAAALLLGAVNASAQTAPDGAVLSRKLNCMSCHAADRTLLGPSLADIRRRYANDLDARDMLARKIQTGGSGSWGNVPMPANTQVDDDEARALVDWILSPNR